MSIQTTEEKGLDSGESRESRGNRGGEEQETRQGCCRRTATESGLCRPQVSIFETLFLTRSKDKQNSIFTVGLGLMCFCAQMWLLQPPLGEGPVQLTSWPDEVPGDRGL